VDQLVRHETGLGYVRSRNELARLARGKYLLFVDDDVVLPDREFVEKCLKLLSLHPDCGVLAFGETIPGMGENCLQPSTASHLCYTPIYFGWTHLFRADVWHGSGGLCELFDYGHEETEHSLRLLDSGVRILYDPGLKVIHRVVSASKSLDLRRNQTLRNGLLAALLRYHVTTLPRVILVTLTRIYQGNRTAGMSRLRSVSWCCWAVFETVSKMPEVLRKRRVVRRETFQLISRLEHPPFHVPPAYPA